MTLLSVANLVNSNQQSVSSKLFIDLLLLAVWVIRSYRRLKANTTNYYYECQYFCCEDKFKNQLAMLNILLFLTFLLTFHLH
jgi:hypothetical protein